MMTVYAGIHVAMAAFVSSPQLTQLSRLGPPYQPAAAVRRGGKACAQLSGVQRWVDDFKREVAIERAAEDFCQPVMFVAEDASQPFDFERWEAHRSPRRYYRLLFGLFFGITTRRITPVLLNLFLFSSLVCIYGQLSASNPMMPTVQLPLAPFELTAPALGLLLVFRSDNAYGRFQQGSELAWEVTTSTRSAIRRLLAWTAAPHIPESERAAAEDLILGCAMVHDWIMNEHLRCSDEACPLRASHEDLLTAALGPDAAIERLRDEISKLHESGSVLPAGDRGWREMSDDNGHRYYFNYVSRRLERADGRRPMADGLWLIVD